VGGTARVKVGDDVVLVRLVTVYVLVSSLRVSRAA
jgi:hypothetical protein